MAQTCFGIGRVRTLLNILDNRKALDDAAFIGGMKTMLGLS